MFADIDRGSSTTIDARKDEGTFANIDTVRRPASILAEMKACLPASVGCSTTIRDIRRDAGIFANINACSLANRHAR
jgi:hypothetical protein